MAKSDDVNALLDQIDTATNTLAANVTALIADINQTAGDGLNGPQTENVLTRLTALQANLSAMASNSANPIPPAPAAAAAMPGPRA